MRVRQRNSDKIAWDFPICVISSRISVGERGQKSRQRDDGQVKDIWHGGISDVAYRDGFAVRLFPVQYPLPEGESIEAGEPVTAAGLAVPAEPLGRAGAVRAGVKARRVLGQGRRRHLPRLLPAQHRAAVEEGRVTVVGQADATDAGRRRDARRRRGRRRGRGRGGRRRGQGLDAVTLRGGRGTVLVLRRRHVLSPRATAALSPPSSLSLAPPAEDRRGNFTRGFNP